MLHEGIERIEQKIAAIGASDWGVCFNGPNGEQKIAACRRLIASGKLGNGDLAQGYFQRAVNMIVIREELDQSLADLNEAIRFDPSHGPPMRSEPPVSFGPATLTARSRI